MLICEEVTMYTKANFDKSQSMKDLVRSWQHYDSAVAGALDDISVGEKNKADVVHQREEISPFSLYPEDRRIFEKLFSCPSQFSDIVNEYLNGKTSKDFSNNAVCDKVSLYALKKINDDLSLEEQKDAVADFHSEVENALNKLYTDSKFDYVFESKSIEATNMPQWAISEFAAFTYLDVSDLAILSHEQDKFSQYLKEKDFDSAIRQWNNQTLLGFMKEVVKAHGTDTNTLQDAIQVVADRFEGVDQSNEVIFKAALMQETLKTDEYKKAFEAEQGKTQENTR